MAAAPSKSLPSPTPETAPFWEGAKAHELRLQYCPSCQKHIFYPRIFCPSCLSTDLEWQKVSGKGTLVTYVIAARPAPGFENETPYAIAIVKLAEGPHLMSNIVGIEITPQNLPAGLAVEVTFDDVNENITLPKFRPAGA